jgi:hypothetical protein
VTPYSEWQPTGFDSKGHGLGDRQGWLVVGVMWTRDSAPLDESNFTSTLRAMRQAGREDEDFEVHRFGHWGPGWFEIILVKPETKAAEVAEEIENALTDYPIVDELDLSIRECEAACEAWANLRVHERLELIQEANFGRKRISIFAARRDEFPQGDDQGRIAERLLQS